MPAEKTRRSSVNRMKIRMARTREIILFSMLGVIMFISKIIMEAGPPNMHFVGVLTVAYTLVYRSKALIPIYIYVLLFGLYYGFSPWWLLHLYIWLILWAISMLIPKKLPDKFKIPVTMIVCSLHGFLFGVFSAPMQALLFGYDFKTTLVWIAYGLFPYDVMHGIHNLYLGTLIVPLAIVLKKFENKSNMRLM